MSFSVYLSPVLFLLSKNPRRGTAECWAAGPQEQGCWGPVAKAGTWHAPGDQLGLPGPVWPSRGTCGTCACSARAAAALAPLALLLSALHAQAAEQDRQLLSHTGSVGDCSKTRTSNAKEEATANWACHHDPPPRESLFSHPTGPVSFLPPLLHGALQYTT